jgi:hypothetical protein
MKLSKAGMLCNNKNFKNKLNFLRKLINEYYDLKPFVDDEHITAGIKTEFQLIMDEFDVGFKTICDVLRTSHNTIYKIIGKNPFRVSKKSKPASLLVDRLHHARLIDEGVFTYKQVAATTGYNYMTVYSWVVSYRAYGNDMLNKAIAFRRV